MMNQNTLFMMALSCGITAIVGPVVCSIGDLGPFKEYCSKGAKIATPLAILFACASAFMAFMAGRGGI